MNKNVLKYREHHETYRDDSIALNQELTLGLSPSEEKVLTHSLAQAAVNFYQRILNWDISPSTPLESSQEEVVSPLISEAAEEYFKENEGRLGQRTVKGYRAHMRDFLELNGDMFIHLFDKTKAREFKSKLMEFPRVRNHMKNAKKSLEQLKAEGAATITTNTVRDIMKNISSFLNWAVKQGYLEKNHLAGLEPKLEESSRRPFTVPELKKIFSHKAFTEHKWDDPEKYWKYWLPLMGLFTGARIEELAMLEPRDIKKDEDGIHYFDINDMQEDKEGKLKTADSRRRIPIHTKLVELGFIRFVESVKTKYLFQQLTTYNKATMAGEASSWFGRTKKDIWKFDKDVVFHSFRHNMRDKQVDVGSQDSHIKAIIGHKQSNITFSTYGSSFKPVHLNPSLQAVDYDEVLVKVKPWA